MRDLYEMSGDSLGKYSTPVLYDTKTNTIVSNESSEIIRMLTKEVGNLEFLGNQVTGWTSSDV